MIVLVALILLLEILGSEPKIRNSGKTKVGTCMAGKNSWPELVGNVKFDEWKRREEQRKRRRRRSCNGKSFSVITVLNELNVQTERRILFIPLLLLSITTHSHTYNLTPFNTPPQTGE